VPEICDRLREAREALGLSQQALAERCGITARSQRNYESGERLPDAGYLAAIAAAGADVLYILTGERSGVVSRAASIDGALLTQVIAGVEQLLTTSGKALPAAKKAQIVVTLYRAFAATKKVDASVMDQLLERVA